MTRQARFFPYNPRRLRIALFVCAVACVALAAWGLVQAQVTGDLSAWARFGMTVVLLGAFGFMFWRIRPREGWGVRVDPSGVIVSRPLSGGPLELGWSDISEIRREGRRKDRLFIGVGTEGGRVIVQRHLFPSEPVFRELSEFLEARAPRSRHDA